MLNNKHLKIHIKTNNKSARSIWAINYDNNCKEFKCNIRYHESNKVKDWTKPNCSKLKHNNSFTIDCIILTIFLRLNSTTHYEYIYIKPNITSSSDITINTPTVGTSELIRLENMKERTKTSIELTLSGKENCKFFTIYMSISI